MDAHVADPNGRARPHNITKIQKKGNFFVVLGRIYSCPLGCKRRHGTCGHGPFMNMRSKPKEVSQHNI